jgi:hypothetical protein
MFRRNHIHVDGSLNSEVVVEEHGFYIKCDFQDFGCPSPAHPLWVMDPKRHGRFQKGKTSDYNQNFLHYGPTTRPRDP